MTRYDERVAATRKTMEHFAGKPLDYDKFDCGKMVIAHLRNMGHRPKIGPGGTWKSLLGLRRFLAAHGGSGAACLDGWGLPRITPAEAWVGDILELPGEPPFGAFAVCIGNGRALGWPEQEEAMNTAAVVQPHLYVAAWRV